MFRILSGRVHGLYAYLPSARFIVNDLNQKIPTKTENIQLILWSCGKLHFAIRNLHF
jgi:hypothetical protein